MNTTLKYRLLFVSTLNDVIASHRFRVVKLFDPLKDVGVEPAILRFHPRLENSALPRLAMYLFRNRTQPGLVVFQKTIAFSLAKLACRMGAHCLIDTDDGSMQRIDGSWLPEEAQVRIRSWYTGMDAIVASCETLSEWALQLGVKRTFVIPTCLDVETYLSIPRDKSDAICRIGWVGSTRSDVYLHVIQSALKGISSSCVCELVVVGATDANLSPDIRAQFVPWSLDVEPSVFGRFDIGIMPLPDNERARMKAGFKLLQYMAAGLPVVASPVGVNTDIVRHGWNGFLATSTEEWFEALKTLIENPRLRYEMGRNGQDFVQKHYALNIAASSWKDVCERFLMS